MSISSRRTVRWLLAAVTAVAVAAAVLKQNEIGRLRDEQKALVDENQEAARLATENKGIPALREPAAEAEKLRRENQDLPKLRNDARQLRRQADELAKLQAEHTQLAGQLVNIAARGASAAFPEGTIMASSLRDAGLATPDAAVQTFFWAVKHADRQRLLQIVTPETATSMVNETDEEFQHGAAEMSATFAGYRIVDKQDKSPDDVTVVVQVAGSDQNIPFRVTRVGGEWKMATPLR